MAKKTITTTAKIKLRPYLEELEIAKKINPWLTKQEQYKIGMALLKFHIGLGKIMDKYQREMKKYDREE